MDLKTLSYFVVVAEELNITRASKILNMSQPPLSNQMKSLEEELGVTLFIRGKRHLTLTEEGRALYLKSKDILGLVDKTKSEIRNMNSGLRGTISIGLIEGIAPDIAANWIAGFTKLYPEIHFHVVDGNSDDLIEKMRSGLISLAVISAPYDANILNSIKVGEEKLSLYLNVNHPLAKLETNELQLIDIKNEPLIIPSRQSYEESIRKWFRGTHQEPNVVCKINNYLDAIALASRGVGISIFPKSSYVKSDSVITKEIVGVNNLLEYLFVWRKGHKLNIIEESFIDYIKEFKE